MSNLQINQSDERIEEVLKCIKTIRQSLSVIKGNLRKRPFNNEVYLTDKELADILKLSRWTLLEWRNNGQIPYFKLGGKILYRESDVQEMLKKHYSDMIE